MANESNIPWLNSKQDISLSTDSMFNLHDEEVKQLLKEESSAAKDGKSSKVTSFKLSKINSNIIENESRKEIPEVEQLVTFITQIE